MKNPEKRFIKYFFLITGLMIVARLIFIGNILQWLGHALNPVFIMLIMIYLLNPLVNFYQKKLSKKSNKNKRTLAVVLTFLTLFIFFSAFVSIILPSLMNSVESIIHKLPNSTEQIVEMMEQYFIS